MSNQQLKINISNSDDEDNLIEIQLSGGESIHVNFSKLIFLSKNFRAKYSETIDSIQAEINKLENNMNINKQSIKLFIDLIQQEEISIPIEFYKDFYTLSQYFNISKLIKVLDNIRQKELYNDLNFSIQILHDSKLANNDFETELTIKIENFLKTKVNECIENPKFWDLPISTIHRIIKGSEKGSFDINLLLDFILESIENRFTLLEFIEIDKLRDDKLEKFFENIDNQKDESKEIFLQYMPFNFIFVKQMKHNYDILLNKFNETMTAFGKFKQEFDQTKQELNQTKNELNLLNIKENQTNQELNQTKQQLNQTMNELNQSKINENTIKQELIQMKEELNQTKQALTQSKINKNQTKQEFMQTKEELNQTSSIIVSGYDEFNQLGEKPTNRDKDGSFQVIYPPINLPLDSSQLLSYSVYGGHSILVTKNGSLQGIGNNCQGQISGTFKKAEITQFTDFSINDDRGSHLTSHSVVCCNYGTLYMLSTSSNGRRQLVYCDKDIKSGSPVFLDIGDNEPVALFGGYEYSSAINNKGEIIFINRDSVKKSPKSPITAISLPDGEKASSVACCDNSVVVLSSNGRVFTSPVESNKDIEFSAVSELSGKEIVCVSGTSDHCLAVSKEGCVFGRGSNAKGQLGLGKGPGSVSFTEILSLRGCKIRAAYAGRLHSLFETNEGKILSCGYNYFGQLLLNKGPGENVYVPTETTITNGSTFCIAGRCCSVVFIGRDPPPNMPNRRILYPM